MKQAFIVLTFLFLTSLTFAQDNFIIGKWQFEKIPDHVEMDEQGRAMAIKFFNDMSLSFDQNNFTQSIMGQSENGTWSHISDDVYEFSSIRGVKYEVELIKISDNQIIFKQENKEMQMIKSDEVANIEIEEKLLDKVEGVDIDKEILFGKWTYNGAVKDGKNDGFILKHSSEELVNYSFLKDGTFMNKAPLEIEIISSWKIDVDNQTLMIKSEEFTELLKVVKLSDTELHLYNPKNDSVITFIR